MPVVIEFNKKTKGDPVKPSYDDVLKLANSLSKESLSEDMSHVLKAAVLVPGLRLTDRSPCRPETI